MKTAVVIAALAVALVLQTHARRACRSAAGARVNLVLVAVVYVALAFGAVTGLLAGTRRRAAQDALAGGIVGIGGLSKTLVGFFVGVLGAQFIVSHAGAAVRDVRRRVVACTSCCFQALYALVESRGAAVAAIRRR